MVDNKIISQVVSALLNQNGGNNTPSKLYGTVEVVDGKKYVILDGSDARTAIVEGTEVINGDRVLVSIENHQAVILANITSPASARTATSYMDFINDSLVDGLVIGEIAGTDGNPPQSIVIGKLKEEGVPDEDLDQGVYLRVGDNVIAKFIGDEFGYSKIEFGPFSATGTSDEYFGILDSSGLWLYRNYRGYDNYDSATRIQPGYVFIDDGTYYTEISSGSIYAENGCNTNVAYVSVSSARTIAVAHNSSTSGTIQAVIPVGYKPCSFVKAESVAHPCYFVNLDVSETGLISYTLHNPGGSDWTDVAVSFKIACVRTG